MRILATIVCLVLGFGPLSAQWQQTSGPNGIMVVSASPSQPGLVFISQAGDFYKQDGQSWTKFASLPGAGRLQIIDNTLFVFRNQEIYRSGDGGQNWNKLPINGTITQGGAKLYNVTNDSLFTSLDQGVSWQFIDTLTLFTQVVVPHKNFLIANVSGFMPQILRSTDGGIEWSNVATPPAPLSFNTFVVEIITDGSDLYALLSNGEIYKSTDDGNTWTKFLDAPTIDVITYSKFIKAGSVFWVESASGIYLWNGSTWGIPMDRGYLVDANEQNAVIKTYEGLFRIYSDIDKIDILTTGFTNAGIFNLAAVNSVVYASAHNGLHRTSDLGNSWEKVSDIAPMNITFDESFIYAHAYEGLYHSTDGGATWSHFPTPRDDEWQDVTSITSDGESIYVSYGKTFGEHSQTNWVSGGMLRSDDHGKTWSDISNGLPANIETHVPVNQAVYHNGTVYIATLEGIFRSDNKGAFWTPADAGIEFGTFKAGMFVQGGNTLYFNHANTYYRLMGGTWSKLPEIDEAYDLFSAYGGYVTGLGDSLFALGYTYDATTQTSTYKTFVFNGSAWTELKPQPPQDVALNSFIRVGSRFMAGSMQNSVWTLAPTQAVDPASLGQVSVYPNPAQDAVSFSAYTGAVTIYDMLGRMVLSTHVRLGAAVNVSSLPSGSYSIHCSDIHGPSGIFRLTKR